MSKTLPVPAQSQPSDPCLIVFGRDEAGKPHASWFDAQSADLALKAADLMQMRVLKVETEEQKALARQLARGRVFATGRAFMPFARESLYRQLVELAGGATGLTTVKANTEATAIAHQPADFSVDGLQALAAAVNEAESDTSAQQPGEPAHPDPGKRPNPRPQSVNEIGIGSLVLAHESHEDGWWEAVVIGINGDAFTLDRKSVV